jgi:threonine dehydratase
VAGNGPLVSIRDVERAAQRIGGWTRRTPILTSRHLDEILQLRIFLKAENLQRTGSFKFRGAVNWMLQMDERSRRTGVIAGSSGNHGAAVAEVASVLGIQVEVVIARDAPAQKRANIQERGASITVFDRFLTSRDALVMQIAAHTGRAIAHSSDDTEVIAGNGTVAEEILDQVPRLDALVVPVGGGGLAAGCGVVVVARNAKVRLYGVEPTGADDTLKSIKAGKRCAIASPTTIADGLRHCTPGEITYPILRRVLDDILLVEDAEILRSMRVAWKYYGVRLEPSGAAALAAVLSNRELFHRQRVAVVASGGNCDLEPDRPP